MHFSDPHQLVNPHEYLIYTEFPIFPVSVGPYLYKFIGCALTKRSQALGTEGKNANNKLRKKEQ